MGLLQDTIEYVNTAFQGKNTKHFERALYWFEQLLARPLTEAEGIAAYPHDIERAFRGTAKSTVKNVENYLDAEFLKYHQERGAEIIAEFLQSKGFAEAEIGKVKHLIERHEQGGDELQTALMNADSISFFETNAEKFATEKVKTEGYVAVKEKLDWMYNRINSDQAKEIARPLYEKWLLVLEQNK